MLEFEEENVKQRVTFLPFFLQAFSYFRYFQDSKWFYRCYDELYKTPELPNIDSVSLLPISACERILKRRFRFSWLTYKIGTRFFFVRLVTHGARVMKYQRTPFVDPSGVSMNFKKLRAPTRQEENVRVSLCMTGGLSHHYTVCSMAPRSRDILLKVCWPFICLSCQNTRFTLLRLVRNRG